MRLGPAHANAMADDRDRQDRPPNASRSNSSSRPASASPSRKPSYNSLLPTPGSLTSALSWTFNRLTSSDPNYAPPHHPPSPPPPPGGGRERLTSRERPLGGEQPLGRERPPRRTPLPPPPLPPLHLTGYAAGTTTRLLSRTLAEEIRLLLPARLQLHDMWTLAYSLEQHGVSLATLYARAHAHKGAFVLAVKDCLGGVCFASALQGG